MAGEVDHFGGGEGGVAEGEPGVAAGGLQGILFAHDEADAADGFAAFAADEGIRETGEEPREAEGAAVGEEGEEEGDGAEGEVFGYVFGAVFHGVGPWGEGGLGMRLRRIRSVRVWGMKRTVRSTRRAEGVTK